MNHIDTGELSNGKFSIEAKDDSLSDAQVHHPILRQIISEVVAEYSVAMNLGSSFGEGGP